MGEKENVLKQFQPGHYSDWFRVTLFLLFLIITILQTYFSLQMEEQLAIDKKYPEDIPSSYFKQPGLFDWGV